jgi:excisionase family DNA binding protein
MTLLEIGELMEYTKSFYTPHEVAEMARVHPSTVLNWIATDKLYAVKLSERTYRIPLKAVLTLLEPDRVAPSSMTISHVAKIEIPVGELLTAEKVYT